MVSLNNWQKHCPLGREHHQPKTQPHLWCDAGKEWRAKKTKNMDITGVLFHPLV